MHIFINLPLLYIILRSKSPATTVLNHCVNMRQYLDKRISVVNLQHIPSAYRPLCVGQEPFPVLFTLKPVSHKKRKRQGKHIARQLIWVECGTQGLGWQGNCCMSFVG